MNGGIYYGENLFSNAYRIPGPSGEHFIYYDGSVPMPPVHSYPTYLEQWHQHTKLLKVFFICVLIFWLLQLIFNWRVGLCMPILFVPSYLLYKQWSKHYQSVELYMISKLYATAFAPGALVVILIETVLTIIFMFICFQSYISSYMDGVKKGSTPSATDPDGNNNNNEGMEFLNLPESPALFIFLILLSYVSAGMVEESLKYYCTNSIKEHRPSYRVLHGWGLYAIASALGFSTVENIGYVLQGALGSGIDGSLLGVFLNTLGRTCISTPLHLMTGYLIGLQVMRRDILGESLNIVQVMGWSVFFHGTFDFCLFTIMVLNHHWSKGPNDNTVSYILMACTIIVCYAGLMYLIWRGRKQVFSRGVEHANDASAGGGGARADVLREAGVVAGGEGQLPLQADAPRGQADRALGGDVDRLRLERLELLLHLLVGADGELDLGIGRQREAGKLVGADHLHLIAQVAQFGDNTGQGAHDAVHLRLPGVGSQKDAHQAISGSVSSPSVTWRARWIMDQDRSFAHSRISSRPSKCSTRAVQLSTQSPSLTRGCRRSGASRPCGCGRRSPRRPRADAPRRRPPARSSR